MPPTAPFVRIDALSLRVRDIAAFARPSLCALAERFEFVFGVRARIGNDGVVNEHGRPQRRRQSDARALSEIAAVFEEHSRDEKRRQKRQQKRPSRKVRQRSTAQHSLAHRERVAAPHRIRQNALGERGTEMMERSEQRSKVWRRWLSLCRRRRRQRRHSAHFRDGDARGVDGSVAETEALRRIFGAQRFPNARLRKQIRHQRRRRLRAVELSVNARRRTARTRTQIDDERTAQPRKVRSDDRRQSARGRTQQIRQTEGRPFAEQRVRTQRRSSTDTTARR